MKVKNTDEYCDSLINFYKNYQTEDKQLRKLIITNLHNVKNRYLKEILVYKELEPNNQHSLRAREKEHF